MENSKRRVLSIQSHVVAGYVGNKSATFPLQVLGFEVDAINSVQLSNHTQYQHCKGQILNDVELAELIEGLRLNSIHHYSHLLTGYVGNPLFLKRVVGVLKELKEVNPDLTYVCDPVMGDNGKMYVPEDLLPIYRDEVIPLADIITPNQYETELLTGKKIKNQTDALEAMEILHSKGPSTVVITSSELGQSNFLTGFASSILGKRKIQVMMEIPRFPLPFTGTGDLCSAALLAWMATTNNDLKKSVEMTISTMQDVLKRTTAHAEALAGPGNMPRPEQMELQLIQSKNDIEKPKTIFQAKVLNSESK